MIISVEGLHTVTRLSTEIIINQGYAEAEKKVVRAYDLLTKVDELEEIHCVKKLNQKIINQVINLLIKLHSPLKIDILNYFQMTEVEIIPGVQCPRCLYMPMDYSRGQFLCPVCLLFSKEAFNNGINDYFLLIKPSFTNPEIRKFLQMPSPRTTASNISKQNLSYTGTKRGRIYHQPTLPFLTNHVFPPKNKH